MTAKGEIREFLLAPHLESDRPNRARFIFLDSRAQTRVDLDPSQGSHGIDSE